MKTATIRDLRYAFPKIEAWLRLGEEIEITKHKKPVARLSPPARKRPPKFDVQQHREQIRRIWGRRIFKAAEVEEMRAFETGEP